MNECVRECVSDLERGMREVIVKIQKTREGGREGGERARKGGRVVKDNGRREGRGGKCRQ